ncbi:unnamed protein product [Calypogeia fissa]
MKTNCSTDCVALGTASVTDWEIETVYTQHWLWKCSTTLGTALEIETENCTHHLFMLQLNIVQLATTTAGEAVQV